MASKDSPATFKGGVSGFTVCTGTHPRRSSISNFPKEVEQAVLDTVTWFKDHAKPLVLEKIKGATSADMMKVEKIADKFPSALSQLLKCHNGGMYFGQHCLFSTTEIIQCGEKSAKMSSRWKEIWIPFAGDVDGNLMLIDADGEVREWDPDTESLSKESLAPSFPTYLEDYRNKLCSGRMEYIEDVGVVEAVGCTSPARRTNEKSSPQFQKSSSK